MAICTQFFTTVSMAENQNCLTTFSESPSAEVKIKLSTLSSQTGRHDLHIKAFLITVTPD